MFAAAGADARPITLAWANPNTDTSVAGYKVYYGTEPGVYSTEIDVGTNTEWTDDLPGNQYYFAVRAYDSDGNLSPFSLEVGDTPGVLLTNPGDQASMTGQSVGLPLLATGSPTIYTVVNLPPGLAVDAATGWMSGVIGPAADQGSPYVVTARVSDPSGYFSSVQFLWSVRGNRAPTVTNPGSQRAIAGTAVNRTIAAFDEDGDPLTFAAAGLPPGLAIDAATGIIGGTVAADAAGTYTVTVDVSDGFVSVAAPFSWTVSAPGELAVDGIVSIDGFGSSVTSPAFGTAIAGETLIAFVSAAQPTEDGVQTAIVSGAGLDWTLVTRANGQAGTAEIWQATASTVLAGATVSAQVTNGEVSLSLTVVTFAGSGGVGASAAAGARTGAPASALTTTKPRSLVFGAGNDWDGAVARTLGPNQTMIHEFLAETVDTFWVQSYAGAVDAAGTVVQISDTAPDGDRWNLAAVEVVALTPTLTATPSMAAPGAPIVASIANAPGHPADWVGLFAAVADNSTFSSWAYLNGSQSQPATGLTSGTVTFAAPVDPGLYNVRLFAAGDSTTPLVVSNSVLVPSSLAIGSVSVVEGNAGTTNARFTVTLSPASPVSVTVHYATADGCSATAGADYVAASGTLTFAPGVTTQTITVAVNGDAAVEPDETFFVDLTGATNATIATPRGVGSILNDDITTSVADGRMFGSGRIDDGRIRHRFLFRVTERNADGSGRLEYWTIDSRNDAADGDGCTGADDRDYSGAHRGAVLQFQSTAITAVAFSDDAGFTSGGGRRAATMGAVVFAGAGKWNGKPGYTFEVRATDRGEPGPQRDTFSLVVKDGRGVIVANVDGTIDGGNIQAVRLAAR